MNNKRIFKSLAVILAVFGLVVGGTWAYFSAQGRVAGNTFSTGTADLEIRYRNPTGDWGTEIDGIEWENLFPGWNQSYDIQLRNVSTADIGLDVIPQLSNLNDPAPILRDIVTLQFFIGDDAVGPEWTLNQWRENEIPIDHLAQGETSEIWTLKFSFIDTGEDQNILQDEEITFDLVFDGFVTEAPLAEITNVTQNTTHGTNIGDAISAANEGDEIVVPFGTYEEEVNLNVDNLTLRAQSYLGKPMIEGKVTVHANGILFEGFYINYPSTANAPIDLVSVNGLTLRNNIVEGGGDGGGISAWTGPAIVQGNVIIENNEVIKGPIGIIPGDESTELLIKDNRLIEPLDEGIWVWQNAQANIVIENNEVISAGLNDVKIVDEPLSINGKTTHRCQAILDDNPGISSVYLEWADFICTQ